MNKFFKFLALVIIIAFLILNIKALAQTQNGNVNLNTNPYKIPEINLTAPVNLYPTYKPGEIIVTLDDLTNAGFTDVKVQPVTDGKFSSPQSHWLNFYFRTNEKVTGAQGTAWGDTADLVSIFIKKMPTGWIYKNGEMENIDLTGRTQTRISTRNYYIVVTGPDKNKVITLTENLERIY